MGLISCLLMVRYVGLILVLIGKIFSVTFVGKLALMHL